MTFVQELGQAVYQRHPDAFCFGSVCYLRLDGGNLAKIEPVSSGGYYNGIQLTILNRLSGPVDSILLHIWDLPHQMRGRCGETDGWDICRPASDITGLSDVVENYLSLFQEPEAR